MERLIQGTLLYMVQGPGYSSCPPALKTFEVVKSGPKITVVRHVTNPIQRDFEVMTRHIGSGLVGCPALTPEAAWAAYGTAATA